MKISIGCSRSRDNDQSNKGNRGENLGQILELATALETQEGRAA
jgi:hypothetical protein